MSIRGAFSRSPRCSASWRTQSRSSPGSCCGTSPTRPGRSTTSNAAWSRRVGPFEFKGGEIFHNAWIGGLFIAVGLTGLAVLVATLFNLITDLVGGVRFTVLEEEVVEKTASPMRRFATRRNDGTPAPQQRVPH